MADFLDKLTEAVESNLDALQGRLQLPAGPDEADKWIADACGPGDVVVTGDIPLAAKCVAAGAKVIKHNGEELSERNIGQVLATRDLMSDLRSADPFRQGGGRPFSKADRSRFLDVLERVVRQAKSQV